MAKYTNLPTYPLHRHLDISGLITAESSPLHIAAGFEPGTIGF